MNMDNAIHLLLLLIVYLSYLKTSIHKTFLSFIKIFIDLNPLSHFMEFFRASLFGTDYKFGITSLLTILISILSMYFGVRFFEKMKKGFADVI